jgi:hypothetical protein
MERYQFMDKIGGEPIKNPYLMIRLDRLTGAVHAFNWGGMGQDKTAFRISWHGNAGVADLSF